VERFNCMMEGLRKFNVAVTFTALFFVVIGALLMLTPINLFGQESVTTQSSVSSEGWAFLAASLSISVSVLGAGIALSKIGAAAMAALAEKPEIMGSAIVFAGLAEGLSIWGLIVAVLILMKV